MPVGKQSTTLQEWFGLNKSEYNIDPQEADFVAFNQDFANDIKRRMERSLITGAGPKFVVLHKRGDGKTHVINYVANSLIESGLIEKTYIICPALARGSRYPDLHKSIVLKMHEQGLVTRILEYAWKKTSSKGNIEKRRAQLRNQISYPDLADAYVAFDTDQVSEYTFINYLCALKLNPKDQEALGVKTPLDTTAAVRVLNVLANQLWESEGKVLMVVIDEIDNLKEAKLGARDFKEAFRQLAESTRLSFVLICNVTPDERLALDVLPSPLKDVSVVTRIGSKNYMVKPEPMRVTDLRTFIIQVNQRLRGEKFRTAIDRAKKKFKSQIEEDIFPFTVDGFNEFQSRVQHFLGTGGKETILLPRSVLQYVNACCGEAILSEKEAIDADVVKSVGEFAQ